MPSGSHPSGSEMTSGNTGRWAVAVGELTANVISAAQTASIGMHVRRDTVYPPHPRTVTRLPEDDLRSNVTQARSGAGRPPDP